MSYTHTIHTHTLSTYSTQEHTIHPHTQAQAMHTAPTEAGILAAWHPGSLAAERQKNEKEQGLAEGFECRRQAWAVAARWKSEWSSDMAKQV